jgi:predicted Zn-dependent protease
MVFSKKQICATSFSILLFTVTVFSNVSAQNDEGVIGCRVSDLKNLALNNNDEQVREKLTNDWLAKYGKTCEAGQIGIIRNNLSAWLGTANTNKISQTVEAIYLEKKPLGDAGKQNGTEKSQPGPVINRSPNEFISTNKTSPGQSVTTKAPPQIPPLVTPMSNSSASPLPSALAPTQKEYALRQEEISQCLPGDIETWGDGGKDAKMLGPKMIFVYAHDGAPSSIQEQSVMSVLQAAASNWDQCGGSNLVVADKDYKTSIGGLKITVQWNDAETVGAIGIANITNKKLTFSPGTVQKVIQINANKKLPEKYILETLQMTASHEMGHFQGLAAHSKRCVDVLSYYVVGGVKCTVRNGGLMPANFYEYRSPLPTACDIERCRSANKN